MERSLKHPDAVFLVHSEKALLDHGRRVMEGQQVGEAVGIVLRIQPLRCLFLPPLIMLVLLTSCIRSPTAPPAQEPTTISLSSDNIRLNAIGQQFLINAKVLDQNNKVIDNVAITWRSGNELVATVNRSGLVTARSRGTTQITVSSGNASVRVSVSVVQEAAGIEISPPLVRLTAAGETAQMVAVVYDQGNTPIPDVAVVWSSSLPGVATVDANGLVTAVSSGTTLITVAYGDVSTSRPVYVVTDDPVSPPPSSDSADDREVLTTFYNAAGGSGWTNNTNWLSDMSLDAWHGVTTDAVGRVTELRLPANNLEGTIPSELGRLVNLTLLHLNSNSLSGGIPSAIGGLVNLNELNLRDNGNLSGPLPIEATAITSLRILSLDGTRLCIPADAAFRLWLDGIGTQSGVTFCTEGTEQAADRGILVRFFDTTGGPDWTNNNNWLSSEPLGAWQGLTTDVAGRVMELNLEGNNLTGVIPHEIGHLQSLRVMSLPRNSLSGEIPAEIGALSALRKLNLADNRLIGEIPSAITQLHSIESLELSQNELSGGIPPEIGQLGNLIELLLQDNRLSGGIPPGIVNLGALKTLRLDENQLTGAIPTEIGTMEALKTLDLGYNEFSGGIPTEIGNLKAIETLNLGYNPLHGEIPTEIGKLITLRHLTIEISYLTGEIPTEIGNLEALETLNLGTNSLSGEIPSEIGNLGMLVYLNLRNNELSGGIPPEIGKLKSLYLLNLRENVFMSGPLPIEITGISTLWRLILWGTQLCAPDNDQFDEWLESIEQVAVDRCPIP